MVDSNGYLQSVSNDNGNATNNIESFTLTNDTNGTGLLTDYYPPANATQSEHHHFTYTTDGYLVGDSNPANGSITLSQGAATNGWSTDLTTANGLTTHYEVAQTAVGESRLRRNPSGSTSTWSRNLSGTETSVAVDGTISTVQYGADPQFGMLSAVPTSSSVQTPSHLTYSVSETRTATPLPTQWSPPYGYTTLTDTITINGHSFQSVFTPASNQRVLTTPLGRTVTYTVDAKDRPTIISIPGIAPQQIVYDDAHGGRLDSVSMSADGTTRTVQLGYYDVDTGFPQAVTDSLSHEVVFTRDGIGRVLDASLPDASGSVGMTYDLNGNVASITPAGQPTHQFSYDGVDRLIGYEPPQTTPALSSKDTSYSFDKDGHLMTVTPPVGGITTFIDAAGRLGGWGELGRVVGYSYDSADRVATAAVNASGADPSLITYAYDGPLLLSRTWGGGTNGGAVVGAVTRTYNSDFRVATLKVTDKANVSSTVSYQYDDDGLLQSVGASGGATVVSYTRDPGSNKNGLLASASNGGTGGISESWTYDGYGAVKSYTATYGTNTLYSVVYSTATTPRDNGGRVVSKTEVTASNGAGTSTTSHSFAYSYTTNGQLASVAQDGGAATTYEYDPNGNRTKVNGSVVGTYDEQDRLKTFGALLFTYSNNGELATKSGTNGGTYTYDTNGLLTAVATPTKNITYIVDAEGHRIGKRVGGILVQQFLWDGGHIVAELDGAGNLVSTFVWGTRLNVPEYMVNGGSTYRFIVDQLGSVRLLVNVSNGSVQQRIDYDEFGSSTFVLGSAIFQPFGFAGGIYDDDTKLVRFGARDYEPSTCRWVCKDPTRFAGGTNVYAYADGDPINRIDPRGTIPMDGGAAWDAHYARPLPLAEQSTILHYQLAAVALGLGGGLADEIYATLFEIFKKTGPAIPVAGKVVCDEEEDIESVARTVLNGERVGSALKDDAYHRAASFVSEEDLLRGQTFQITGGDGLPRTLLQTPGNVNGQAGVYEYLVEPSGQISHQLFKPGGTVDGTIN